MQARTVVLLAALFPAAIFVSSASKRSPPKPEKVAFCELVRNPKHYDQHIVQVRAIFETGPETARLYDPTCCCEGASAWVEYDHAEERSSPKTWKKLDQILGSGHRAYVVFVGRFDGPRNVKIPKGINPKLADVVRKANSGYGHMNAYAFQFIAMGLKQVRPVPSSVPEFEWNKPKATQRSPARN